MGGIAGNDDSRKQNHCEIEKRRRDKMNHYITELASVIPAFNNNQSRLDKLTVLRMAVQHVKSLRSSLCSFSSFHLRPSFLSSGNLLKNLILQMASQEAQDNLFMVVTCDRGKVLFVSKSSKDILNQDQSELVGQSLFDILHKDDVSKVKEQISYFNLMPKEMLVDSKTLQPIKSNQRESFIQLQNQSASSTLQPGSRRSFFCRMKSGRIWPPGDPSSSKSQGSPPRSSGKKHQAAASYQATADSSAEHHHHHQQQQQQQHHQSDNLQQQKSGLQQKQAHQSKTESSGCQDSMSSRQQQQQQRENRPEKVKQSSSGKIGKSYKRSERHHHNHAHSRNHYKEKQSRDFEKSGSVCSSNSSGKSSSGQHSGSDSSSGISSAPTSSSPNSGNSSSSGSGSGGDNSCDKRDTGGGSTGQASCCTKVTKKSRDRERFDGSASANSDVVGGKIVDKTNNNHGRSLKTNRQQARNQRETRLNSSTDGGGGGGGDRKQSSAMAGSHVNARGERVAAPAADGASARQLGADRNSGDNGGLDSHGSSVSGRSGSGDNAAATTTTKSSPLSFSSSPSSPPASTLSSPAESSSSSSPSSLSPLSTSDKSAAASAAVASVDKNNTEHKPTGKGHESSGSASYGDSARGGVVDTKQQDSSRESSMSTSNNDDSSGQSCNGSAGAGSSDSSSFSMGSAASGAHNGVYTRKQWRYIVMHCSGYLKAITLRNDEYDDDDFDEKTGGDSSNDSDDDEDDERRNSQNKEDGNFRTVNCLVVVCRRSVMDRDLKPDRPLTFTCRYSMEGKFTFVDQRTTVALGYTPQQLIGTSHYAYCHKDSVNTFKECHRQCILKPDTVSSDIYQFKRANGQHLWLQTSLKSFRNPWTKFIDYIVANHTTAEGNDPRYNEGCVPTKFNQDMTCEANSQSSSPASSSSVPSEECKKSTSPSSSSMGSSYSMESYASGGSIQALLNQIDRVKSGGHKHHLELPKRRSGACHHHNHNHNHHHHHHPHRRSATIDSSNGSSSARKSNYDSGNFSDLQSCSSVSSQNSGSNSSGGFTKTVNNFVNQASDIGQQEETPPKDTASNHDYQRRRQKQPLPPPPLPPPAQVKPTTGDQLAASDKEVACAMDSSSYAYPQKQEQEVVADFGASVARARDDCGQQSAYATPNACRTVVCPSPMTPSSQICAQTNFVVGSNLVANGASSQHEQYMTTEPCKPSGMGGPRMVTVRMNRPPCINSTSAIKPLQRPYQYSYRAPHIKSSMTTQTVNMASHSWPAQTQTYTPNGGENSAGDNNISTKSPVGACTMKDQTVEQQHVYVMHQPEQQAQHQQQQQQQRHQQQQMAPVDVIQMPAMQGQPGASFNNNHMTYQNTFPQPVGPYAVDSRYMTNNANMGHTMSHVQVGALSMSSQQQQQQQQQHQHQQQQQQQQQHQQQTGPQSNEISMPMVWNSSDGTYSNIITTNMHGSHQIACHQVPSHHAGGPTNMVGMEVVDNNTEHMEVGHSHCHQCAGHKCCAMNQPMVVSNNGDFNSMHLSSLAVDDLDESELLECLAACDPDSPIYNIQNNTYQQQQQYNVYRGQQ